MKFSDLVIKRTIHWSHLERWETSTQDYPTDNPEEGWCKKLEEDATLRGFLVVTRASKIPAVPAGRLQSEYFPHDSQPSEGEGIRRIFCAHAIILTKSITKSFFFNLT